MSRSRVSKNCLSPEQCCNSSVRITHISLDLYPSQSTPRNLTSNKTSKMVILTTEKVIC